MGSRAQTEAWFRARFEASLSVRIERAEKARLQNVIPSHWFSAAASECVDMYIAGHFYGCISVAQAYVEALGDYLREQWGLRKHKDVVSMWTRLADQSVVSGSSLEAALAVFSDRNAFHHLNREVESEYTRLAERALRCVNNLHTIESDVFAHSFQKGQIVPGNPRHWTTGDEPDRVKVWIRNI